METWLIVLLVVVLLGGGGWGFSRWHRYRARVPNGTSARPEARGGSRLASHLLDAGLYLGMRRRRNRARGPENTSMTP